MELNSNELTIKFASSFVDYVLDDGYLMD